MRWKYLFGLSLVLAVFLSGCITAGPSVGVGGAIDVSFVVDSTSVPKNSPMGATITMENNALVSVTNVRAMLYGPMGWDLGSTKTASIIRPEDIREFVWTIRTPDVEADTPYNIYAQTNYDMTANKTVTITIVTYDYYKRTKTKSGISPSPVDLGGPIKIDFGDIGRTQYIYPGETSTDIPIRVIITNVGPGKAYLQGTEPSLDNGLNKLTVSYRSTDDVLYCEDLPAGSGDLDLTRDGTSAYLSCRITVDYDDVNNAGGLATFTGTVTGSFSYIQDIKSPTIVVTSQLR